MLLAWAMAEGASRSKSQTSPWPCCATSTIFTRSAGNSQHTVIVTGSFAMSRMHWGDVRADSEIIRTAGAGYLYAKSVLHSHGIALHQHDLGTTAPHMSSRTKLRSPWRRRQSRRVTLEFLPRRYPLPSLTTTCCTTCFGIYGQCGITTTTDRPKGSGGRWQGPKQTAPSVPENPCPIFFALVRTPQAHEPAPSAWSPPPNPRPHRPRPSPCIPRSSLRVSGPPRQQQSHRALLPRRPQPRPRPLHKPGSSDRRDGVVAATVAVAEWWPEWWREDAVEIGPLEKAARTRVAWERRVVVREGGAAAREVFAGVATAAAVVVGTGGLGGGGRVVAVAGAVAGELFAGVAVAVAVAAAAAVRNRAAVDAGGAAVGAAVVADELFTAVAGAARSTTVVVAVAAAVAVAVRTLRWAVRALSPRRVADGGTGATGGGVRVVAVAGAVADELFAAVALVIVVVVVVTVVMIVIVILVALVALALVILILTVLVLVLISVIAVVGGMTRPTAQRLGVAGREAERLMGAVREVRQGRIQGRLRGDETEGGGHLC
ncbi:hypothetical protein BJ546DRAFT_952696 [Cryomyces antarcticus]